MVGKRRRLLSILTETVRRSGQASLCGAKIGTGGHIRLLRYILRKAV